MADALAAAAGDVAETAAADGSVSTFMTFLQEMLIYCQNTCDAMLADQRKQATHQFLAVCAENTALHRENQQLRREIEELQARIRA